MGRGCLAVFLIFLLMIAGFLWLMLFQFRGVTEPRFLIRTLEKSKLYEAAPKIAAELTNKMSEEGSQPAITSQMLSVATNPDVLKKQVESLITGSLNYFRGKTKDPVLVLYLAPFKKSVGGNLNMPPETIRGLLDAMAEMPVCPANVSDEQAFSSGCRPGNLNVEALQSKAATASSTMDIIPDNLDIGKQVLQSDPTFLKTRQKFHRLAITFWVISALSILLIGLMFLISGKDLRAAFRRSGVGLFVPGLLSLMFSLLGFFAPVLIKPFVLKINGVDPALLSTIFSSSEIIIKNLLTPGIIAAAVLAGLGFALMITALFFKKLTIAGQPIAAQPQAKT